MPDDLPILPAPTSREEIAARSAKRLHLARQLDDTNSRVRQEAIQACQSLSPKEICALLNMAEQTEIWQLPRWLKFVLVCTLGGVCFSLLLWLIFAAVFNEIGIVLTVWFMLGLIALSARIRFPRSIYTSRIETSLAEVVKGIQNPDFLPDAMRLLYAAMTPRQQELTILNKALYEAVTHWLLTLDIEQIRACAIQNQAYYWLIGPEQAWTNPQLAVRVLHILEQIGTPSAIPTVAHLAHRLVFTEKNRAVKAAAQACLTTLEQRAHAYRQPETLLRPSSAPKAMPDTLLRPAHDNGNTVPEQLLRPSVDSE